MKTFTQPMEQLNEIEMLRKSIKHGQLPAVIDGCIDAAKSHLAFTLGEDCQYTVIVTYSESQARTLYESYKFFNHDVYLYPAKDLIFFNADVHGNLIVKQRLQVIRRLLDNEPTTIITTVDGLMDSVLPLEKLRESVFSLEVGYTIDMDLLIKKLVSLGFERTGQIEDKGQFSVRGGIVDIYNVSDECPYRIEFWDDEVDSIRSFDVESQRSIENCEKVTIYPASEFVFSTATVEHGLRKIKDEGEQTVNTLKKQGKLESAANLSRTITEFEEDFRASMQTANVDGYIGYFYEDTVCFLDYFNNEQSLIFIDESSRIEEKGQAAYLEFYEGMTGRLEKGYVLSGQMTMFIEMKALWHRLGKMRTIVLETLSQKQKMLDIKSQYTLTIQSIHTYNSNFEMLVKALNQWKKNKFKVVIVCGSTTRCKRLVEDLAEYNIGAFYSEDKNRILNDGEMMIVSGHLSQGMAYPMIKFAIISETDIFGEIKKKKRRKSPYSGEKIQSFMQLSPGDYVVHEKHGVGIYRGIEKIEVDHVQKDYVKIEYAGDGNLYVLATQLDAVQKYAGADAKKPKINKLNSPDWHKTKTRVRGAVKELAGDLIRLYAARQSREGFVFSEDTLWQHEFEEMFPYSETDDQLNAIEATKKDMESKKIMDRLICGDVGYGKTEVAIRAAFKAVQDGKQVVVLVPTTILAQQHYNTFSQRMKDYPVTVDMLSRFRTKAQQADTLKRLKTGLVDILIGTHRVLSKDIVFKDLGLLVVDEEQRFGVAHKEKIKNLKQDIDVLTLTATPIPRTLHMSLIGIRDMSVLEEPPQDRMPIQTYVMEYQEEMVKEAILREVTRGGQVYYVFNRVNGIIDMANTISALVPEATVAYAHGQMSERELEKIMYDFINGDIDVLVSTTIIETGLDISNVNTMIIHDADQLGLSQLYQLRGRVGRSSRMAYAFLLYRRNRVLKEVAEKRLAAIREFTELGSGFKIAMKDLEIRGAGNLLGASQSGHMESVGYDLYCKMLGQAVSELKGDTVIEEEFDTTVDMDIDAFIPGTYIKNETQKLEIYKRIAAIDGTEAYEEIADELMDRYGELPKAARNLLEIALIRVLAHEAAITQLVQKGQETKFVMYNRAKVDINRIPPLLQRYKHAMKFVAGENPFFTVNFKKMSGEQLLKCEKTVIKDIKALLES